ncbi:MAG: hypothetical protein KKA05_09925, partial [Alphaproteobacteria bacterium]|nr:hypothetical protein [Alphaproteobacteria bacterium]
GLNKTLDLIIAADDRRERLHYNAGFLRGALSDLGYNTDDSQSQIIALESGTEWQTMVLKDALESKGIFGSVFCAPATAKKRALVRFSVNSSLTDSELKLIVDVCVKVFEKK